MPNAACQWSLVVGDAAEAVSLDPRATKITSAPTMMMAAIDSGKARFRLRCFVDPPARAARATFLADDALPIGPTTYSRTPPPRSRSSTNRESQAAATAARQ